MSFKEAFKEMEEPKQQTLRTAKGIINEFIAELELIENVPLWERKGKYLIVAYLKEKKKNDFMADIKASDFKPFQDLSSATEFFNQEIQTYGLREVSISKE